MLGVVYKGIAIPLYWDMLDKRGNTNHLERAELIERFIKQFGKDNIVFTKLLDKAFNEFGSLKVVCVTPFV